MYMSFASQQANEVTRLPHVLQAVKTALNKKQCKNVRPYFFTIITESRVRLAHTSE